MLAAPEHKGTYRRWGHIPSRDGDDVPKLLLRSWVLVLIHNATQSIV